MGFFDFISDAGAKIFGKEEDQQDVTKPIIQHIAENGIDTSNMKTQFKSGTVVLSGYVPDQEQKEKAVIIAGNIAGDTLSKIAKEMYGDAMKYPLIFEANRPMLKDPDHIYPGQVLRIPKA